MLPANRGRTANSRYTQLRPRRWLRIQSRALRRSYTYRVLQIVLVITLAWTFIDLLYVRHALAREFEDPPELGQEKVFVASIHWNTWEILETHWMSAVLQLAEEIGRDNVFVSIQESGSWDGTKGALMLLESKLKAAGIPSKVILDPTTHADEVNRPPGQTGWIKTTRNRMELRRIQYLARLRNFVMEPLYEMQKLGLRYDRILFLNDVAFSTDDIRTLLSTRDGDYAAACSLDFKSPPAFYDTMALRDSEGHDALMQTWPFFRSRRSRSALKSNSPVPVSSCWNGIVAMDAAPFYADSRLTFRGIPDSLGEQHVEGSECCLIHADNPLTPSKGVWLNPRVRVTYNGSVYDEVSRHPPWQGAWTIVKASWTNRILRWFTTPWFKNRIVSRRLTQWESESPAHREKGTFCLINEMQVLVYNGWKHL